MERNIEIVNQAKKGDTFASIAIKYCLSREIVRIIVKKNTGHFLVMVTVIIMKSFIVCPKITLTVKL